MFQQVLHLRPIVLVLPLLVLHFLSKVQMSLLLFQLQSFPCKMLIRALIWNLLPALVHLQPSRRRVLPVVISRQVTEG